MAYGQLNGHVIEFRWITFNGDLKHGGDRDLNVIYTDLFAWFDHDAINDVDVDVVLISLVRYSVIADGHVGSIPLLARVISSRHCHEFYNVTRLQMPQPLFTSTSSQLLDRYFADAGR